MTPHYKGDKGGFVESLRKNTINILPTRTIFCRQYTPPLALEGGTELTNLPEWIAE